MENLLRRVLHARLFVAALLVIATAVIVRGFFTELPLPWVLEAVFAMKALTCREVILSILLCLISPGSFKSVAREPDAEPARLGHLAPLALAAIRRGSVDQVQS